MQVVATVLTACGIETLPHSWQVLPPFHVATVLTACGIETFAISISLNAMKACCNSTYRLRY